MQPPASWTLATLSRKLTRKVRAVSHRGQSRRALPTASGVYTDLGFSSDWRWHCRWHLSHPGVQPSPLPGSEHLGVGAPFQTHCVPGSRQSCPLCVPGSRQSCSGVRISIRREMSGGMWISVTLLPCTPGRGRVARAQFLQQSLWGQEPAWTQRSPWAPAGLPGPGSLLSIFLFTYFCGAGDSAWTSGELRICCARPRSPEWFLFYILEPHTLLTLNFSKQRCLTVMRCTCHLSVREAVSIQTILSSRLQVSLR